MSVNFLYRNNFEQDEDLITEVLEADKNFLYERKIDFLNLKNTLKPNVFMSFKQQYLKFTHLVTQNAILASVIMLFALTTVGASAAELFAPKEFKPSTQVQNLFQANKQQEKDPYTALKPDDKNDVVISEACDLAIKYPKTLGNTKINLLKEKVSVPPISPTLIDGFNFLAAPSTMEEMEMLQARRQQGEILPEQDMVIRCLTNDKEPELDAYIQDRINNLQAVSITSTVDSIKQETGWFVTEAKITNLQHLKGGLSGQISSNPEAHELFFEFNNKLYWIMYYLPTNNSSGVFANQVQLQFNSLVKNEANATIIDINVDNNLGQTNSSSNSSTNSSSSTNEKSQIQPLIADNNHDVVVIKECDLAVRYNKQVNYANQTFTRQVSYIEGIFSLININQNVLDEPSGMSIVCNKKVMQEDMYDVVSSKKSKQEICTILNLTKTSCDQVENFEEYLMTKNYTPNRNILFKFIANNNEYKVLLGYLNQEKRQGLENIQIQFNSLAPSTPSVSLNSSAINSSADQNQNSKIITDLDTDCSNMGQTGCDILDAQTKKVLANINDFPTQGDFYKGKKTDKVQYFVYEGRDMGAIGYVVWEYNFESQKVQRINNFASGDLGYTIGEQTVTADKFKDEVNKYIN